MGQSLMEKPRYPGQLSVEINSSAASLIGKANLSLGVVFEGFIETVRCGTVSHFSHQFALV